MRTTSPQASTPRKDDTFRGDYGIEIPPAARQLRTEVRAFLSDELEKGTFTPHADAWLSAFSPDFSKKLAGRGWLGMTWPEKYGGHSRSVAERYAVIEELLAAGAPVAAHWIADRQTGPLLLRYGTPEQCTRFLPAVAKGECYFSLGMSEPDSGSDLASVRTRAEREYESGWRLSGNKVWTSHAHRSHYVVVLARTERLNTENRHLGLTQFIVDLSADGVEVNPIALLSGEHHFNEVVLDDVHVGDDMVVGTPGSGWEQVTSELAYERSGPERFLSTFPLFTSLIDELDQADQAAKSIGGLWAEVWALRSMSMSIADALDRGEVPTVATAAMKDLGTRFESRVIDAARHNRSTDPTIMSSSYRELLSQSVLSAPGFTLRGGTNEILRGIIARELGLR